MKNLVLKHFLLESLSYSGDYPAVSCYINYRDGENQRVEVVYSYIIHTLSNASSTLKDTPPRNLSRYASSSYGNLFKNASSEKEIWIKKR